MKISGCHNLEAPRSKVWSLLLDPSWLSNLIPGCEWLEQVSPGNYHGQIRLGVAAVGGTYEVSAKITEKEAPDSCQFEGEISGPTGTVTGNAMLTLKEVKAITSLSYEVQAMITGGLASIPPHFVEGVARTLIDQGLSKLNIQLKMGKAVADDATITW